MMRGLKMLVLGLALAFPAGFAAGVATAVVLTSERERAAELRRAITRRIFGVEPAVDFESLNQ